MSAQADGQPLVMATVRDVLLRAAPGASVVQKPHWLLPLPVVGGGVPITRH